MVTLGDRHDARVDKPEVVVGVRGEDLAGALVVDRREVDDAELTTSGSGNEAGFGGVAKLTSDQSRGLDHNRGRHEHLMAVGDEHSDRGVMPAVVAVRDREQDSGVDNNHKASRRCPTRISS